MAVFRSLLHEFWLTFKPPRTFLKRKGGLFKKAHELSVLCSVDVAVIIFGHNKKLYEYSSGDINETIGRFQYVCAPHSLSMTDDNGKLMISDSMAARTNTKDQQILQVEVTSTTMMTTIWRLHRQRNKCNRILCPEITPSHRIYKVKPLT